MLLHHSIALSWSQTSEGEHTDLVRHVVPGAASTNFLESGSEELAHLGNSVSDSYQLVQPLLSEIWLVQNHRGNPSTVTWRGGIVDPDDDLDLGKYSSSCLAIFAHEMKSSGSLTVETHDLGEGLGDNHFESLVEEVAETLAILVEVTSDETLVSSVEEWIQRLLLANLSNLLPLIKSGIDSSWIVGAGV